MSDRIDQMIAVIIKNEGDKYTNIPGDKGGPTKDGITLKYAHGVGFISMDLDHDGDVDERDIMLVTAELAATLYRHDFFEAPRISRLPVELQPQVFDTAVNSGPPRSIQMLQRTLGKLGYRTDVDGVIGPEVISKANAACTALGWAVVNDAVVDTRKEFYRVIVKMDPSQQKFIHGWINRAESWYVDKRKIGS